MLDTVLGFVSNNTGLIAGGGVTGIVLWVLKKVPNEEIANIVETFFYGCGKALTLGMSKWRFTRQFWNKTIEPWFIDLVDNVIGGAIRGFIRGLRID